MNQPLQDLTPKDILSRPMEPSPYTLEELSRGCYFDHTPERMDEWRDDLGTTARIVKDFDFDHRRYWRIAVLYFEEGGKPPVPFMIVQNAGREGDDFSSRYLLDQKLYRRVLFAQGVNRVERFSLEPAVPLDKPAKDLGNFYGNHLDGLFQRNFY